MSRDQSKTGFISLCYHYLRGPKETDPFPKILGTQVDVFREHLDMLTKKYQILSLEDVFAFFKGESVISDGRYGLLITFDDGLSDHYTGAKILYEYGIKGTFFIPTTILEDGLPANPNIIHYTLAEFGIAKFLEVMEQALSDLDIENSVRKITFDKNRDNSWETIAEIKTVFKYALGYNESRAVLLYIYKNLFGKRHKNAMNIIHLDKSQISEMISMGHSIGSHTRSHISVAATELSKNDFEKEIVDPKFYLEETFNTPVKAFSYPFGGKSDCLSSAALLKKTRIYDMAFTVEPVINTQETSVFEVGRYQPRSTDTTKDLQMTLQGIIRNNNTIEV